MKLPIITVLFSVLLTGCAYQEGVIADRNTDKTETATPSSTTVDTNSAATPTPIKNPASKGASSGYRAISPLTS